MVWTIIALVFIMLPDDYDLKFKTILGWTTVAGIGGIALILMQFFARVYMLIPPLFLGYAMIFMVELSTTYVPYYVHESSTSIVSATFLLIIFIPTQWKSSSAIVFCGWLYYIYQVYARRDVITVDILVSAFSAWVYFTASAYMLNSKFKELMRHSYRSEKQALETTKVLEIFPHGVIIQPGEKHR